MTRTTSSVLVFLLTAQTALTQSQPASDSLLQHGTLQNCVQYALVHQPIVHQSLLDEEITEREIQTKLADWYPQLNLSFNVQHNPQLPVSIVQNNIAKVGLADNSSLQLSVSQTLFNRDVLLASSSATDVRDQVRQRTANNRIAVVVNVSKAYYAALLTEEQIQILNDDVIRLEQSLKDALAQYQGGIVDKIDYKRATISLNNARAERKQSEELLKARYASLREQMGYPAVGELKLEYDSTQMERQALIDTNETVRYESRIEYQLLQTQKRLQEANLDYYEWSFLPSLSAYGSYILNYQSSQFAQLYNQNYPYSFVGLQLSFPIFQGGKRIQEIRQARMELERVDYDEIGLKNAINTEFSQALAEYKSNLNDFHVLKENLELAQDVYNTIQLQYKAGTKTYLEVLTAETDLRTAQINHTNALYQLLSSKLDLERARGTIQY